MQPKKDLELNRIETDSICCAVRTIGTTAVQRPVVPDTGRTAAITPVHPIVLGFQGLIREFGILQMILCIAPQ